MWEPRAHSCADEDWKRTKAKEWLILFSGLLQQFNMAAVVDLSTFEREIECKNGILRIKQTEVGDESCVVWDAALVLAKYLQTDGYCLKHSLKDKRVIELGAGTGIVGLVAACCG